MINNNLNNSFHKVVAEIQETIEAIGQEKFISKLKEIREDSCLKYYNKISKLVIITTSDVFEIEIDELIYGNLRLPDKTHALGIIAFILMNEYGFKLKEISIMLNKNNTNLSRWKNEILRYDKLHTLDAERINKFKIIKHKLQINKLKNND